MKHKKGVPTKDRSVYVIELDSGILDKKFFSEANPDRDPAKPCLYVGMTALTPEQRFEVHKSDNPKRSNKVHKYGIRLLPHLYEHINPLTWVEAVKMEKELADTLRNQGYAVWQK
jgi:hypothetical protein